MKLNMKRAASAALLLAAAVYLALRFAPLPPLLDGIGFSRVVLDRNGSPMYITLTNDEKYRLRVALHEVPRPAVDALILYEDRYFRFHPGVNPLAVLRAGLSMLMGGRRMGASTITMQTARMRYGIDSSTIPGKLRQVLYALCPEARYSKDEILEAYFNLAPYGGCIEGIGAASRVYFHRPVWDLTETEIVTLIPVPQNPALRSPAGGKDSRQAAARLAAMRATELGTTFRSLPPLRVFTTRDLPFEAPHAVREALNTAAPGTERIRTHIDLPLYRMLQKQVRGYTERYSAYGVRNASVLLIHAPSSEIRALIGSADFFGEAIYGQVDGTLARRSPGSTLKPFIYALALEQGLIHPKTLLLDSRRSFGGYDPENFDKTFRGPIHADDALVSSRNIPAISLAAKLRDPGLYDFLSRAGVRFPHSEEHYGLSLVLGGAEVTMQELGALYAMLLNSGIMQKIELIGGGEEGRRSKLLSSEAAYVVLRMLERSGLKVRTRDKANVPLRFKTGTSNGFHDAWCAGTVGQYVLIVWVGDFANRQTTKFVGGEHAVPLWMSLAEALNASVPLEDPAADRKASLNVTELPVCAQTGDIDVSLCSDTVSTLFIPGVSPIRNTGFLRRTLVDVETGMRSCPQSKDASEYRVVEFWPTEYRELFRQAGIVKAPPPPLLPVCGGGTAEAGRPPVILQPREGSIYYRRLSIRDEQPIPFRAGIDADAGEIFWFADSELLGVTSPGETLLRELKPGTHTIRASDEQGRSSVLKLTVRSVP